MATIAVTTGQLIEMVEKHKQAQIDNPNQNIPIGQPSRPRLFVNIGHGT